MRPISPVRFEAAQRRRISGVTEAQAAQPLQDPRVNAPRVETGERRRSGRSVIAMLGQCFIAAGILVGTAASIGIFFVSDAIGVGWLLGIGLVKISLLGAFSLIAIGAFFRRFARENRVRES